MDAATRCAADLRVGIAHRHRRIHRKAESDTASGGRTLVGRAPGRSRPARRRRRRAIAARHHHGRPRGPTGSRRGRRSATRCRSWPRCSRPMNRCRCRRTRVREQAVEGFAREDRLDIPLSAPTRNYRDRSHKPELLVALGRSRRWPASGPVARTIELLRALVGPGPRSVHRPAVRRSPMPTGCGHCSRPGSPHRRPISTCWCRRARRRRQLPPFGRRRIRRGGQDRAGARRALSRRRGRAGRAAAQPDHAWQPGRASTCPRATCTPTCTASASR